MAEELAKKKKVRGTHKGVITKLLNKIEEITKAEAEPTAELESKLKQYEINLKEKLDTLIKLDDEIFVRSEDKDIDAEIQQSEDYKSRIYEALVAITDKLKKEVEVTKKPTEEPSVVAPVVIPKEKSLTVKLPKLQIKKFTGNAVEWQAFWDSFDSSVNKQKGLAKVEKFCYLRNLLEGVPYTTIAGFALTDSNYDEAVKLLKERYGRREMIVNSHMDSLANITPVTLATDIAEVRLFYEQVETHIRALDALDISMDNYGALLTALLLKKLPDDIRLEISRKIDPETGTLNLKSLLKMLKTEIVARERVSEIDKEMNQLSKKRDTAQVKGYTSSRKLPVSSAALITSEKNGSRKPFCLFCNKAHYSANCKIVNNLKDRKLQLKKLGRFFRCTQKGHLSKHCKNTISCHICSGNHHSMVCERRFKTLNVNSSNVKEPTEFTGATKRHTTMETQTEEPVVTVNAHVNSGVEVFLQTAIAQISKTGKPNEPFVKARVIFDGGAQRSYINQKLVDQLELPTVNTEKLKISTFGEKAQEVKMCNLVELNISNPQNNFKTTLNAFSVPFICDKLKTQNVRMAKERFTHLSNIKFSDELPPGLEMEVDILIGADYMWAFMESQTKQGEFDEPVAVLTKLGWVISGPMKMECKEKLSSINFVTTHILKVSQLQDYHMKDNLSTQRNFGP